MINIKSEKPFKIKAQDDAFNRKVLEQHLCSILVSPEAHQRKESIKHLDSGLNHVLAAIAAKNKIAIGIDLEDIRHLAKKEKAQRLAKIRQNLKICRKTKTSFAIHGSQEGDYVLLSLGASTTQAKEAQAQSF